MKQRGLEELAAITRGHRVVLANGCFDILHVGHVRYLEGAAQLGDTLVVAVNGDRSVRQLKGEGRPILGEEHRVSLVSALECVDHVVVFNETDVCNVIEVLRPSVHAKGTDYTEATVPEGDHVREYGGQVRTTGDPKNHSTKDILSTIVGRYS